MPINPVQFAHGVCDEFLRYLFSAFPLSDPELAEQARTLLERPSSLDIPLVKGPFVSLSESFAKGESDPEARQRRSAPSGHAGADRLPDDVPAPAAGVRGGEGWAARVWFPPAPARAKRSRSCTRSWTICCGSETRASRPVWRRSWSIPMNALANDQLDRLRDMLGGTGITFGQWVGTTPDKESDVIIERFGSSSRQAFLAERKKRREEAAKEDRAVRPLAPPRGMLLGGGHSPRESPASC